MPEDLIQIGSFYFSKSLLDVLAPLFGTLIGGFITFLTTRRIEILRWEKDKGDKLLGQRQEALGLALEWIDALDYTTASIALLMTGLLSKIISVDEFSKRCPNLLVQINKSFIPQRSLVLLPDGNYSQLTGMGRAGGPKSP
jgi:hypothetical protein